jgi:hypothetical protein
LRKKKILEVITMRKLFVLFLLGLCVCFIGGCCNCNGTGTPPDVPDTPDDPQPPTNNETYLTWNSGRTEIYVTKRPIQGANNYSWVESGTGEYSSSDYYFGDMGVLIPYGTKFSDGSVSLTVAPYEEVDYTTEASTEFNDTSFVSNENEDGEAEGTEPDVWHIGTAPSGRTASDYTLDENRGEYVYNGGSNSNTNTQQTAPQVVQQGTEQTPSASSALLNEDSDDEDVNGNVSENDGRNLSTNR